MHFVLTEKPIDPASLREALVANSAGAFCSYEGWVRDHNEGMGVVGLHYYGYPQLAPNIAELIVQEVREQYAIEGVAIAHHIGELGIGDIAVWVGVTAHHRGDTFGACHFIIDQLKHRLPIWKKEIYTNGCERWIESNHSGFGNPT